MAGKAIVRKAGEGDAYWMLGGLYEVKVSSEESGGAVTVMQMTVPAGMGPPRNRARASPDACSRSGPSGAITPA